jgi:hypothetical protein
MHLFAYLDPGTGSVIVQSIIAGAVGLGVLIKAYWHRIMLLFKRGKKDDKDKAKKDLRS